MLSKNILRIICSYRFSLVIIVFFELLFMLRGYKGNKFNISKNNKMSDNISCPFYFLFKIIKTLKKNNFNKFCDLGCGSGRTIDFFSKTFSNKKYIGIEFFFDQYDYCKKLFKNKDNIEIIQSDFTKLDFQKYNVDCFFLNDPFKNDREFLSFVEKLINIFPPKKNILFIFVNCDRKLIQPIKKIECIENYYITNTKGYSIYRLDK